MKRSTRKRVCTACVVAGTVLLAVAFMFALMFGPFGGLRAFFRLGLPPEEEPSVGLIAALIAFGLAVVFFVVAFAVSRYSGDEDF